MAGGSYYPNAELDLGIVRFYRNLQHHRSTILEVSRERWYLLTSLGSRQCQPKELLRLFRNHWSVENSLHHVKDRSWDEDVHTLRRPGLGEIFATLVNTGLNVLRLEGWFPARISMPLRAKTCAFRPTQTIARLYGRAH